MGQGCGWLLRRKGSGAMVLLLLEVKAELESITNLVPKGGSDGSEYTFFFKVTFFRSQGSVVWLCSPVWVAVYLRTM